MTESFDLAKLITPLLGWYDTHARTLPWRKTHDPYHIWISEIMLQQTRVEAVISYYERFLHTLPDIKTLAEVDEEKLLKLWEGLGYYSRARNLKKAAQAICQNYNGEFPHTYKEILSLPGIGPYTAGAISSIAFGLPEPAVDGNVLRVLSRLREDPSDINDPAHKKRVTEELRDIYPAKRSGDFTQSLMELGAIVCLPNGTPLCEQCPLRDLCLAHLHGTQDSFPVKSAKKRRKKEQKTILLLCMNDRIAIEKRPSKGLLAGLWQFPMADGTMTADEAAAWVRQRGFNVNTIDSAEKKKHIFTHIEWEMSGYLMEVSPEESRLHQECASCSVDTLLWVTAEDLQETYSLPTAFRQFIPPYLHWRDIHCR